MSAGGGTHDRSRSRLIRLVSVLATVAGRDARESLVAPPRRAAVLRRTKTSALSGA
jgi:hypothetical protein